MKTTEPKKSDVIDLLDLVWSNANDGTSFSYERLNHGMRAALSLAIDSGFVFAESDIKYVMEHYRSGKWIGASTEWIYSAAVAVENDSAVKSYEAWIEREPIIADTVTCSDRLSDGTHGHYLIRARSRLFVGARFPWKGLELRVTSFADDQSYVNACSYKKHKQGGYFTDKLDKRFKITRADILADRAERKKAAKRTEVATVNED